MLHAIEILNPSFTKMLDNIYIGNFVISFSRNFLYNKKIKLIINCTSELENTYESINTFKYYRIPFNNISNDDFSFLYILETIIDKIRNYYLNHTNILIFCYNGVYSSITLVIAYVMKYYNLSVDDSILFISSKTFIDSDILYNIKNILFKNILIDFEYYLKNKL